MSAEEFARLKHDIESRQVEVDRAFARLDDFEHAGEADSDSTESSGRQAGERLALLESLMETMSKLNASYKVYVELLERRVGF